MKKIISLIDIKKECDEEREKRKEQKGEKESGRERKNRKKRCLKTKGKNFHLQFNSYF